MGRRWHCEWQDSEEELFQAYQQATDTRLRFAAGGPLRTSRSGVGCGIVPSKRGFSGIVRAVSLRCAAAGKSRLAGEIDGGAGRRPESVRGDRGCSHARGCHPMGA